MRVAILHDPTYNCMSDPEKDVIYKHRRDIKASIQSALEDLGHATQSIETGTSIFEQLQSIEFDIAFNISCEDQAFGPLVLEKMQAPYTGSDALSHMLAIDKPMTKNVLRAAGVKTPKFQVFSLQNKTELNSELRFPLFAKPSRGGCSYGISNDNLVFNKAQLTRVIERIHTQYNQPALVEEFAEGREFTIGILENSGLLVLPVLEISYEHLPPGQGRFRTFDSKMLKTGLIKSVCPAQLSRQCVDRIKKAALAAYRAVGCRDFARVDIRFDVTGAPQVLEVNSLPGLDRDFGSFTRMASEAGMEYHELVQTILLSVCKRHSVTYWTSK